VCASHEKGAWIFQDQIEASGVGSALLNHNIVHVITPRQIYDRYSRARSWDDDGPGLQLGRCCTTPEKASSLRAIAIAAGET
jgi:hypothetical protein